MKKTANSLLPAVTALVLLALCSCYLIFVARLPQQLSQQSAILAGSPLSLEDTSCPELSSQQAALDKAQVYLIGEVHGVQGNQAIALHYLPYFIQNQQVRYLLLEAGPATAGLFNLYLETGDEALLAEILSAFEGSFACTEDYYIMLQDIKRYNDTLPSDKKLCFVGIDREQQPLLLGRYLSLLLPDEETDIPEHIAPLMAQLRQNPHICRDRAFLQELSSSLQVCPEDYEAYLGEKQQPFAFAVENVLSDSPRDTLFLENFQLAQASLPDGKFFGVVGLSHLINGHTEAPAFALQLKSSTNVFTLELRYMDCSYLHPANGETKLYDLQPPIIYSPKGEYRFYTPEEGTALIEKLQARSLTGDCLILVEGSPASQPFS